MSHNDTPQSAELVPDEIMFSTEDTAAISAASKTDNVIHLPLPQSGVDVTALPMPEKEQTPIDGIEILVNLAKQGKIDPWNVDIVQVTEEYLKAIKDLTVLNLKLTGKTLLMAAILLRMKSDQLGGINFLDLRPEIEDADLSGFDDEGPIYEFDEDGNPILVRNEWHRNPIEAIKTMSLEALGKIFGRLDNTLDRRTSTKAPRVRRVTLDDLVEEFKRYEELERKRALEEAVEKVDKRRRRVRSYENMSTDEILELAHDEFIEETIVLVKVQLAGDFTQEDKVSLSELIRRTQLQPVAAFVALLFLASRGEIDLEQHAFYEELYILPQTQEQQEANNITIGNDEYIEEAS